MDCYRSFNFSTTQTRSYSGSQIKTWTSGGELFWQLGASQSSYYNIAGFKNIDVYGIDVIGNVQTSTTIGDSGLVNDWAVLLFLDGQIPLVGGNVTTSPNDWNIQDSGAFAKIFEIGKYTNKIKFVSPYKSVKQIQLLSIIANGQGAEAPGSITLDYNLNFIVYYKFEGE